MQRLFFFSVLLFSSVGFGQLMTPNEYGVKTDAAEFNLKGQIQKVVIHSEDVEGKSTHIPLLVNEYYTQIVLDFTPNNQLSKVTNYLPYQQKLGVYSEIDYRYTPHKLLSEQITTVYNNGEDPKLVTNEKQFSYSPAKQLQEIKTTVRSKSSTTKYTTQFVYANALLTKIVSMTDGAKSSENNLIYNRKNLLVSDELTNFDGKIGKKKYYIYDGLKPVYQEEQIGKDQQLLLMDEDQKIKTYQRYNAQKKLMVEVKFNPEEEIISVKKNTFRGPNTFTVYTLNYQKDAANNWVVCEVYNERQLVYRLTRTITYQ